MCVGVAGSSLITHTRLINASAIIAGAFLFARNHDRSYNGLQGLTFATAFENSGVIIIDSRMIILGAEILMAGLPELNLERASHEQSGRRHPCLVVDKCSYGRRIPKERH
jgi:hypothetical protein